MTDARAQHRLLGQNGAALLVTLTALALLSAIAALAVVQARSDFLIHHHTRDGLTAFTIAEAGLALAMADLERDARFSRLANATDGHFPFSSPPPSYFPREPLRFEVGVVQRDSDQVDIVSQSFGAGRASARVAVTVRRGSDPFLPAALHTRAAPPSILLGDRFRIDGGNRVPGIAVADPAAARALAETLDAAILERIDGEPPIGSSDSAATANLADRAAASGRPLPGEISGALGRELFFAPSALSIDAADAAGILVVDGDLSIASSFRFEGVIVVGGDLLFADDSDVQIRGAVLQRTPGRALHLRGRGAIQYDASVLRALDGDFAGLLERRASVLGWRDDS
jgi:hypothetical protein